MNKEQLIAKLNVISVTIYDQSICLKELEQFREMHRVVGPDPLGYLEQVLSDYPAMRKSRGLCSNIFGKFVPDAELSRLLKCIIRSWDEFSGNTYYPVSHPTLSPYSPNVAYYQLLDLYEGEYGAARKRLLVYVMDCFNALFDDEESN